MHNIYLFRIWLHNRRGMAPTTSCQARRFEWPPKDGRHTLLKSEPLVQSRGLSWDGFNHASVVARHEDFQTRDMMCESLRCRSHGTFLSVFSEVLFMAQNGKKKKVIGTIKHDQHWVFNCHLMCLQRLFLIVNPMRAALWPDGFKKKKKKSLMAYTSNYLLGFVDIRTHIVDWDEWNKTTGVEAHRRSIHHRREKEGGREGFQLPPPKTNPVPSV